MKMALELKNQSSTFGKRNNKSMKTLIKISLLFALVFFTSCSNQSTQKDKNVMMDTLSNKQKIDYINDLPKEKRFSNIEKLVLNRCFESPIQNIIKFKNDHTVLFDWMYENPNGKGLVFASESFSNHKINHPFTWQINEEGLIIKKTPNYHIYSQKRSKKSLLFKFENEDVIVYNEVITSLFRNRIKLKFKNDHQALILHETDCNRWPQFSNQQNKTR